MPLSCIVTTYNKPDHLDRTLAALRAQLQPDDEILVVNDGGNDASGIAETHGARCVWIPDKGYRLATARNVGLWLANHDTILQLDDDVLLQPGGADYVREVVRPGVLIAGKINWLDKDGNVMAYDERLTGRIKAWDGGQLLPVAAYGGLMAYSRSDAFRVGLWCEEYNGRWGGEDADFGFRMLHPALGDCVGWLSGDLLGHHQWHPKRENFREEQNQNRALLYERMQALVKTGLEPMDCPELLVQIFILHWRRRNRLRRCLMLFKEALDCPGEIHVMAQDGQHDLDELDGVETPYVVHYLGPNRGCFYPRWHAARFLATAPFVIFWDDDLYPPKGAMSRLLAPLISGDADVVIASVPNLNAGKMDIKGGCLQTNRAKLDRWTEVDYTGFGASAFRREVFEKCEFDPEYFVGGGDLDMSMQLKEAGFRVAVLPMPGLVHEGGGDPIYVAERWNPGHINASWRRFKRKWGVEHIAMA